MPKTALPERTLIQKMEALAKGNRVRTKRKDLKQDLKAGKKTIHILLLDPPEYVDTMKLFDAMLAVPKYGCVSVDKVLKSCRISPSKTIGGLSERQRAEIISMLRR